MIVVLLLNWWKGAVGKDDADMIKTRFELLKNQILAKLTFKIKKGEICKIKRKINNWLGKQMNPNIRQCIGKVRNDRMEWTKCSNPAKKNEYSIVAWERNLCEKHQSKQQAYYFAKHTYNNTRIHDNYGKDKIAAGELLMREEYEQMFGQPADNGHQIYKTMLRRISLGYDAFPNNSNHIPFYNYYDEEENEEEVSKEESEKEINNNNKYAVIAGKINLDDDPDWDQ